MSSRYTVEPSSAEADSEADPDPVLIVMVLKIVEVILTVVVRSSEVTTVGIVVI